MSCSIAPKSASSRAPGRTWSRSSSATRRCRSQPQQGDWGRHVATIPNVILVRWLNEEYAAGQRELRMFTREFDELVARKLADPDWAYLRVDK